MIQQFGCSYAVTVWTILKLVVPFFSHSIGMFGFLLPEALCFWIVHWMAALHNAQNWSVVFALLPYYICISSLIIGTDTMYYQCQSWYYALVVHFHYYLHFDVSVIFLLFQFISYFSVYLSSLVHKCISIPFRNGLFLLHSTCCIFMSFFVGTTG